MPLALSDRPALIERVLVGEDDDPARRGSKRLVARSHCRFSCKDDETLDRCVDALKKSDETLRKRPAQSAFYDWQSMTVERHARGGGILDFGVAWYDEDFFEAKHNVFLNPLHHDIFDDIGMETGSISISHWKLIGEAIR